MGDILSNTVDLSLTKFATLSAIKGNQFGKDVYSSVIQFKDLASFLEVFPSVQRDVNPRKVASIRRYIRTGLENEDNGHIRFFSAITVTCRGHIFYDDVNKRLAIDTNNKMSINDGQHRFEAINSLIDSLESDYAKSKDKENAASIRRMIDSLEYMTIPVVIFSGLNENDESQLFHDLNNLAQRPSRNTNIRLNQTDIYSRMARDIAENNRYLKHYGVEYEKMSIHSKNPNTILLTTIYASIKELLNYDHKSNQDFLTNESYEDYKKIVSETFDSIFFNLPNDIDVKGKYLIEKSFAIKAISKFIARSRNLESPMSEDIIFKTISNIDWSNNIEYWRKYNGSEGDDGNILFGGGTNGGLKSVYKALLMEADSLANKGTPA